MFCALTEARAHRYQLSVGKALLYLAENPRRYDVKVVRALAETVAAAGTTAEDATSAVRSGARAPVAAA